MKTPSQKTALVTGANKGIGREVARQLADRGFRVWIGARRPDAGRKAAAEIPGAELLVLDVADAASISRAARELSAKVDHLDLLVNNAGICEDDKANAIDVPAELVRRTFETNTLGPLLVTRAMMPLLEKAPAGARVVNVSSGAGALHDMENWAPAYSISKTALNAVTRQLASVLHGRRIAVNSVCPGWVRTDMGGEGAPRSVAQGADTIVWLATEASGSDTGGFYRDRKITAW